MPYPERRSILVIACLISLSRGIFAAALGPLLPELAANGQVSLAVMGSLITVVFLGGLIAQLTLGPLTDRIGQMPVLVGAVLLIGTGSLSLAFSHSFGLTLALTFLAGLGLGAGDLSTSVLVARAYADRSVSALNLLNLFFGVGAFVSPALAGLSYSKLGSGLPVLWLVTSLLLVQAPFVWRIGKFTSPARVVAEIGVQPTPIYRSPTLWLLGAMLLLYVGVENGIAGWITAYMQQTTAMVYEKATLVASTFWIALTAGRLVGALAGMRWSAQRVLSLALGGALSGGLILATGTGSNPVSLVGVIVTGFCFGSVFPTVVSLAASAFPANPGKAVGAVTAAGSIGGMLVPWMLGLLLVQVSARVSMVVVALIIALLVGVFVTLQMRGRSPVHQPQRG